MTQQENFDMINTVGLRQTGGHFATAIFKCIFWNKNYCIFIRIPLKLVPRS